MAEKRKRGGDADDGDRKSSSKKAKRGFVVGPDHLPDGAYKRKTQKIKSALIERAQIKKNYAKLKRQGKIPQEAQQTPTIKNDANESEVHDPSTTPHPDRQNLMNQEAASPSPQERSTTEHKYRKPRKPKSIPFQREYEQAQKRKAEAEERRKAREEAERQRQLKITERERFRKAMEKARRGGPNGQRKLGRESKPLLERVKRLVGEGG